MRVLWFSDVHLHRFRRFAKPHADYGTTRVANIIKSLYWVHEMVVKHRPDRVVFGGDWVHSTRQIDFPVYSHGVDIISEIAKIVPLDALRGNHDMTGEYGSAVHPLGKLDNVRVISKVTTEVWGPHKVTLMPYSKDIQEHPQSDIIFCHHDIIDFKSGKTMQDRLDAFRAKLTVSGHYHIPSVYQSTLGHCFCYGGSLLPHSFVDVGSHPFGCLLLDLENLGSEKIKNPYARPFLVIRDMQTLRESTGVEYNLSYLRVHVRHSDIDEVTEILGRWQIENDIEWEIHPIVQKPKKIVEATKSGEIVTDVALVSQYVQKYSYESPLERDLITMGQDLLTQFDPEEWLAEELADEATS